MPLLFYWRHDNYARDLDEGAGYNLNSKYEVLHEVEVGDSVWAFTRVPDGTYALASQLVVRARTHNAPGFQYGKYRVWGNLEKSRYFRLEGQESLRSLIRRLSPKTNADKLYHSFMGPGSVRRLTEQDHQLLHVASRDLPEEPRAQLLPEEELETILYTGNKKMTENLVREQSNGLSDTRRRTITREVPDRNRTLVERLRTMYGGRCQLCKWNPIDEYGEHLCEGHHIQWLSRGGDDRIDNLMLVCPNHHRAIHRCDAPLDYDDLALDFGTHREPIQIDRHLQTL
jgi:hypothetical protein